MKMAPLNLSALRDPTLPQCILMILRGRARLSTGRARTDQFAAIAFLNGGILVSEQDSAKGGGRAGGVFLMVEKDEVGFLTEDLNT